MKACMALILTSLLLVTAGSVADAEMAKEGSATGTTGFTTTYQTLAQGKEYAQANYDARGVVATENEASPLYMSSVQCIGSVTQIGTNLRMLIKTSTDFCLLDEEGYLNIRCHAGP